MKIVHVISGYLPDDSAGTQMQVRDLCHEQRGRGHDVQVFTRVGGTEYDELSLSASSWEDVPAASLTISSSRGLKMQEPERPIN